MVQRKADVTTTGVNNRAELAIIL